MNEMCLILQQFSKPKYHVKIVPLLQCLLTRERRCLINAPAPPQQSLRPCGNCGNDSDIDLTPLPKSRKIKLTFLQLGDYGV